MNRADRLLEDLTDTLASAASLVDRGRDAYDTDPALPLAFEALSNRVGDICKQLTALDADRFADETWSLAARNRDFIVHHYNRVDRNALWNTVARDFPRLAELAANS